MENEFSNTLEKIKNGSCRDRDILISSYTPESIQRAGFEDRKIYISQKHIRDILDNFDDYGHKHDVSEDNLLDLVEKLEDPAFIYVSENRKNSIGVFTGDVDHLNQPILCSFNMEGYVRGVGSVYYITSVYGKRPDGVCSIIKNSTRNNSVLFIDTDKCLEMLEPSGYKVNDSTYRAARRQTDPYAEIKRKQREMTKDYSSLRSSLLGNGYVKSH